MRVFNPCVDEFESKSKYPWFDRVCIDWLLARIRTGPHIVLVTLIYQILYAATTLALLVSFKTSTLFIQDAVIREPADAAARAGRSDGGHPRRRRRHQGGRRRRRPRQEEPAAGQFHV